MNAIYDKQTAALSSKRTADGLIALLKRSVYEKRVVGATGALGRFSGRVGERDFRVQRVLERPDPFEPVIRGRVEPDGAGCKIVIAMTPQTETNRALMLLCLFFALATALCLWRMQLSGFRAYLLSPALLLALCLSLPRVTFRSRCREARAALERLL